MWPAVRFQSSYSKSICNLFNSRLYGCRILHLSTYSKKTREPISRDQAETTTINSLFKEITDILGIADVVSDESPTGISLSKQTRVGEIAYSEGLEHCTQDVCGIAEENDVVRAKPNFSALGDAQVGDLNEIDVSRIVHEIAGVVPGENVAASMEERLERLGFVYEQDVVDEVLKKCFKVPHLAFRFFNWVETKDGFRHTTKTYNTMLYIAGESKEFGLVDKLVEQMEKNSCEKDIQTWTILILHYVKAKLTAKALLCFEKMKKSGFGPDVEAYTTLMRSLCFAGKGDIALELYKEMIQREMLVDLSSYKLLLNCLAKEGEDDAVNIIADDMIRIFQIPERDVHFCVLKSFCVAGRIREALELIRSLKSKAIPLDYEYFETLVKGLCRADRIEDAVEIVEIMKKRHFVDANIYGIIINGYLRRKELSKALDLYQNMKESGYWPTTSTYTELMQHLFRLNEYQKGCELYNEMVERGIETDVLAIMTVASGHLRQNHIPEAWEVFKTIEDKGFKLTWRYFSMFIKELCKVARTDEIIKILQKMQASKIFIHDDKTFKWIISYMEKKGEMGNVKKIKQMQKIYSLNSPADEESMQQKQEKKDHHLVKPLSKGYDKQDLAKVCGILSSQGDWCGIQEALEKCSVQFTPELVVEILRNSGIHGNAALRFFTWVRTQTGYLHTAETYNMAMKVAGRGKDFKHMRSLFYEMKRNNCLVTADTWAIMIMQYGRTGLTEIALKTFSEMKANGCNPTGSTFKCLIICLCEGKGKKVDEAINIFEEMIRAGYVPDRELVETYLCCLCEAGKLLEARRSVESLCNVGFTNSHSYSLYIRSLCRAGRLEEALSLLNEVEAEKSKLDQSTYASLVHGLLRKGRLEEALAKVESMKQAGIRPNVHVHTSLIVHYFKEKQTQKALEIFEKMRQEGCEPTIVTYSALIRGYVNVGKVGDAWNVFNNLKQNGPTPDFKTYSMFISCLCEAGKSEEALHLISEMVDNGIAPSALNFRTVFYGLNREGKQDLAQTVLQQKQALIRKRKFLT